MKKSSIKPFVALEGAVWSLINCVKWCPLSHRWFVYKFENEKIRGCGVTKKWAYQTSEATSITHLNLWLNCQQWSCIVGNVGTTFWQGGQRRRYLWFCCIHFYPFFLNCPSWVWQHYKSAMLNRWSSLLRTKWVKTVSLFYNSFPTLFLHWKASASEMRLDPSLCYRSYS